MIDRDRQTNGESFRMGQETQLSAVDALEQRLLNNVRRWDKKAVSDTLLTYVTLSNGTSGTVREILDDPVLTTIAIEDATSTYDTFNEQVGMLSPEDRERIRLEKQYEITAARGVRERATTGRYNGSGAFMQAITEFKIGSYISVGSEMATNMLRQRPSSVATGEVIFDVSER